MCVCVCVVFFMFIYSLNIVWLLHTLKIMHIIICANSGVYSRKIIYMFLVYRVYGLVENFNIGIFSSTINVIRVKLCVMVLLIDLYLFTPSQRPSPYFNVTAESNDINFKFDVIIRLTDLTKTLTFFVLFLTDTI